MFRYNRARKVLLMNSANGCKSASLNSAKNRIFTQQSWFSFQGTARDEQTIPSVQILFWNSTTPAVPQREEVEFHKADSLSGYPPSGIVKYARTLQSLQNSLASLLSFHKKIHSLFKDVNTPDEFALPPVASFDTFCPSLRKDDQL